MPTLTRTAAAVAGLLAATAASAEGPTTRGFDPDPVRPAFSLDGDFAVETAGAAPAGTRSAAFLLDFADGLLALKSGDTRTSLLASRLSAHLLGGWSFGRLELGADLPMAIVQQADFSLLTRQGVTGPLVAPVSRSALGDLRLGAKLPFLEAARTPLGVGLALALDLRLPTGDGAAFTGDGLMAIPAVVATRAFGPARVDAQLGYALRDGGQYAQLVVHDGLTWGLGASYDLPRAWRLARWRAIGEVTGGWPRGNDLSTERYRAPLSARAGLRAFLSTTHSVEAGAGTGIGEAGYGRESWRVFAGIRFWPRIQARADAVAADPWANDRDHDGVPDADDACPDQPGSPELDGCPDRDGDGIPDNEDRCPDRPGPASSDGCPPGEEEPLVEIETERLSLKDAIQFDTGKDTITRASFKVLDEIAGVLGAHPEIGRVRVEGHTDNVGAAAYNKDLSERRARAVAHYLSGKGIGRERLVPEGFGLERPIANNRTALGRAKNRRVEFTIVTEKR